MAFSILHISDLHQDLRDEIPTEWLLDSLADDLDVGTRSSPAIMKPSVCIVSGDIIYGVAPSAPNADQEIKRQYDKALEFLCALADRLFDGNRERIVIVPGNHDVEYSKVLKAGNFIAIPSNDDEKKRLVKELLAQNSTFRWSWSKLEFFSITDYSIYNRRIERFADMYYSFYGGKRSYSLDSTQQYDIFDFSDLEFSVLALNSCHKNDPLNRRASIDSKALACGRRELSSPSRAGWVLGATWHHDIQGREQHEDFLDPGFIQILIEAGVTIGMHGHQHRSDCFDQRSRLGDNPRKMTVISAGTLCADSSHLSPGKPRGYNVIELDVEHLAGRVHQRQMGNDIASMPIWGPGMFVDTQKSYMDFELSPPKLKRPPGLDAQLLLEKAADAFGKKQFSEVLSLVSEADSDPMARQFFVQALIELGDPSLTLSRLTDPKSAAEAIVLGAAVADAGTTAQRKSFLELPIVVKNSDASLSAIVAQVSRKRK